MEGYGGRLFLVLDSGLLLVFVVGLLRGLILGLALWEALALSRGSALRADFDLLAWLFLIIHWSL